MHLANIDFDGVNILIEIEFVEELNHSKSGDFRNNSGFKPLKSFSIISTNHELVAELRE